MLKNAGILIFRWKAGSADKETEMAVRNPDGVASSHSVVCFQAQSTPFRSNEMVRVSSDPGVG